MMKKMLCLMLALLLCPTLALAGNDTGAALTYRELTDWAAEYIARAMKAEPLNNPSESLTPDGYEFVFPFATIYADMPEMNAESVVRAVVLTSEEESALRGVNVGAALETLLAAYYSENDELLGTYENAVLFTTDALPESASWGEVLRDGQRVQTVQYAVHEQLAAGGEGYTNAGVIYTLAENRVSAVRVYGLDSRISLDQVNEVMFTMMYNALHEDYAMVPVSFAGDDLTAFGQEDLIFSGLDFLNLMPDQAIELLGEPMSDLWMDNEASGYIRVQTYANCELIYLFNRERTMGQLYLISINADGLEGPRCVRIGDSFSSVYNRFRHGEGEYQEDGTELLYGSVESGTYGMAEYDADASAVMRFAFTLEDGRQAEMQLGFTIMELTEILVYAE